MRSLSLRAIDAPNTNANQRKRQNETTTNAEQQKNRANTKDQTATPSLRPLPEAVNSIDWGPEIKKEPVL